MRNVLEQFYRFEQKKECNESGGILLGYVTKECEYIRQITTPNKYDYSESRIFIRKKEPAQKRINKYWKISKESLIYLGEWHTHCEINPKPSLHDINMIQSTLLITNMEIDFLYLIIVGMNNTFWIGKCTKNGLEQLYKEREK